MIDPSLVTPGTVYRRTDIPGAKTRVDWIGRDGFVRGHTFGDMISTACAIPLERFSGIIEPDVLPLDEGAPADIGAGEPEPASDSNSQRRNAPMSGQMFEIPFGEHIFVLARPKTEDWSKIDGSTMQSGNAEWRPCMVKGHNAGQRLFAIGSPYGFDLDRFEIDRILTQDIEPDAREDQSAHP